MRKLLMLDSLITNVNKLKVALLSTCMALLVSGLLNSILPGVVYASPVRIAITENNKLDFHELGENYRKRSISCRISSADVGSVVFRPRATRWLNFTRIIVNARKRLRNQRSNGNMRRVRRIRANIREMRASIPSFQSLCSEYISALGVAPRPSPTPTLSPTPTPLAIPPASFQPIRINSGGPSDNHSLPNYTDSQGNVWVNDSNFFGVESYFHAKVPIPGTSDQEIWMTERYGPAFSYRIPLEDAASYTVVLHIGEIFWHNTGQRIFDVYLEGTQIIANLDLIQSLGRYVPAVQIYTVNVTDGMLDIDFFGVQQYAKVNGIEILRSPADYKPLF